MMIPSSSDTCTSFVSLTVPFTINCTSSVAAPATNVPLPALAFDAATEVEPLELPVGNTPDALPKRAIVPAARLVPFC